MKKFAVMVLALVFLCASASAETIFTGSGFQLTLPDGWTALDAAALAQIAQVAPDTAQTGTSIATSDTGASLCAFARESQGITTEFMELFQSEYLARIEAAVAPAEVGVIVSAQTSCGPNNFFHFSLSIAETPVSIYYYFSGQTVVTLVFSRTDAEEITQILSTLSAIG